MTDSRKTVTAVLVSVEYGDLLAYTLPRNRPHFSRVIVVTSPDDHETIRVARRHKAVTLTTRCFWEHEASFNKGLALEHGLELGGLGIRDEWFAVMDADILLPHDVTLEFEGRTAGCLYVPPRRIVEFQTLSDPATWGAVRSREEFAGFFQLFHSQDPVLSRRPWYPTDWRHAGGCDTEFWKKWQKHQRRRPPFEVLHIGPEGQNWCGRVTPRLDGSLPPDHLQRSERMRIMQESRDNPWRKRIVSEKIEGAS